MTDHNEKLVALTDQNGGGTEFPVLEGSIGPEVIDIRKLYAETNRFTCDPGFTSTASCSSWKYPRSKKVCWRLSVLHAIPVRVPRSRCAVMISVLIRSVLASVCAVRVCRPSPTS